VLLELFYDKNRDQEARFVFLEAFDGHKDLLGGTGEMDWEAVKHAFQLYQERGVD